jgi:PAS domain S-box-containing protein
MEQVKITEAILNGVLDSVACGVMVTDKHLRITRLNKSGQLISGKSENELIGKTCAEVMYEIFGSSFCPLAECLKSGHVEDEYSFPVKSQGKLDLLVRVASTIIRNRSGEFIAGIQTFGDISTLYEIRSILQKKNSFFGIIGRNREMERLYDILPRLAKNISTVLIRGESGTGKELFANALHKLSDRSSKPFIAVNCGALPDTLLESELFGHVKGAFTDAFRNSEGRISAAEGGTLFLDEVGDISPTMQVKLLRFLQNRTYEALGSNKQIKADVRVVAATNRDLEALLKVGKIREDFYYRLNVLSIDVPPLRNRIEDIPLLVNKMIETWSLINNKHPLTVTPIAMKALMSHNYPGNVRELENVMERAAVLAVDDRIDLSCFPTSINDRKIADTEVEKSSIDQQNSLSELQKAEKNLIIKSLENSSMQKNSAASSLGYSRSTLWRKMKKYGLA